MSEHYFSHFTVNGEQIHESELSLQINSDVEIVAVYEEYLEENRVGEVGGFVIYASITLADFYIINTRIDAIVARFPSFDECVQWIKENSGTLGAGAVAVFLIGLGLYVYSKRKK